MKWRLVVEVDAPGPWKDLLPGERNAVWDRLNSLMPPGFREDRFEDYGEPDSWGYLAHSPHGLRPTRLRWVLVEDKDE